MMNVDALTGGVRESIAELGNSPLTTQHKERTWFLEKLKSPGENPLSTVIEINGVLHINCLQQAYKHVINTHEILRTAFNKIDTSPGITRKNNLNIDVLDFSRASFVEIKHFIARFINRSFEHSNVSVIRAILIKGGNDFHYLCVALHPIVTDRWSIDVFCEQLIRNYESIELSGSSEVERTHLQYSAYLISQKHRWNLNANRQELTYWEHQLSGCKPAYLKTDFLSLSDNDKRYSVMNHSFSDETSESLLKQTVDLGIDMNLYSLACFKILLSKCIGQDELIVGVPFGNREEPGLESVFGPLEKTLPIRSNVDPFKTFEEYVSELTKVYKEAAHNQHIPCDKLQALTNDQQSLIQTKFVFEDSSKTSSIEFTGLRFEWNVSPFENCPYEMTFTLVQEVDGLKVYVVYRADLFKETTILNMIHQFDFLIYALTTESTKPLSDISLLEIVESEAFDSSVLNLTQKKNEGLVPA